MKVQKKSIYFKSKCDIINIVVTFNQFNASLLNKNVNFLKKEYGSSQTFEQ